MMVVWVVTLRVMKMRMLGCLNVRYPRSRNVVGLLEVVNELPVGCGGHWLWRRQMMKRLQVFGEWVVWSPCGGRRGGAPMGRVLEAVIVVVVVVELEAGFGVQSQHRLRCEMWVEHHQ